MSKKSYLEKLKDPRWQKKRLEIFERDEWKCFACGNSKETLHIHHTAYIKDKDPWDYDNDMLVTLCERCHKDEHDMKDDFYSLIEAIKQRGFLYHHLFSFFYTFKAIFIDIDMFDVSIGTLKGQMNQIEKYLEKQMRGEE